MSTMMLPDQKGYYGEFGGSFVPAEVQKVLDEIAQCYLECKDDPQFQKEFEDLIRDYVGRPSVLYYAEKFSEKLGGAKVYFKREDLNHTGAHKINNTIGQVLLAKRLGKSELSRRQVPVNTVLLPLQPVLFSIWSASSTWVKKIPSARRLTSSAWSF